MRNNTLLTLTATYNDHYKIQETLYATPFKTSGSSNHGTIELEEKQNWEGKLTQKRMLISTIDRSRGEDKYKY